MVDMQMGQQNRLHVARADPKRLQPRPDFLLAVDVEAHGETKIRMPLRQAHEARVSAGVDNDDAVGMLDRIGVDRQPVRPFRVDERPDPAR